MQSVDTTPKGKTITIDLESWNDYKRLGKCGFNKGVMYVLDILIHNQVTDVVIPTVPAPPGYRGIWAVDGAVDLRKKCVYLSHEQVAYARLMGQGNLSVGLRALLLHYKRLSRKGLLKSPVIAGGQPAPVD